MMSKPPKTGKQREEEEKCGKNIVLSVIVVRILRILIEFQVYRIVHISTWIANFSTFFPHFFFSLSIESINDIELKTLSQAVKITRTHTKKISATY